MSILQNIENYNNAMIEVLNHCMALKIERANGKVTVYYPCGYYPDGIRVDDTAHGLRQCLEVMERHWLESFP